MAGARVHDRRGLLRREPVCQAGRPLRTNLRSSRPPVQTMEPVIARVRLAAPSTEVTARVPRLAPEPRPIARPPIRFAWRAGVRARAGVTASLAVTATYASAVAVAWATRAMPRSPIRRMATIWFARRETPSWMGPDAEGLAKMFALFLASARRGFHAGNHGRRDCVRIVRRRGTALLPRRGFQSHSRRWLLCVSLRLCLQVERFDLPALWRPRRTVLSGEPLFQRYLQELEVWQLIDLAASRTERS